MNSKYSIGRILKTPTEIKQDRLIAKHRNKIKRKTDAKLKAKLRVGKKGNRIQLETPAELKKLPYKGFLLSKYWQHVRKLVLKRDNYQCIICKEKTGLQVHHDTYKNHFNELNHLQDLMTLCEICHKEHHYAQN